METKHVVYRYPGVKPFEADEQALFFGRDRDIQDLCDMIRVEKLSVLFGKSGYGKSSILNAGVLPRLRGTMLPIEVRLGEYLPGQSLSPVETLLRKLAERGSPNTAMSFLQQLPVSLWTQFKQTGGAPSGGFLLVFDQFEEFFSYPAEQQRAFREQLAELLNEELPEAVRELARTLDREQRRALAAPVDVRVLLAVRSDRLHELDRLKDQLPGILHKRYELRALSREQAREAIIGPAALTDPRPDLREGRITMNSIKDQWVFASPPFSYQPDAIERILADLTKSNTGQRGGVEAFQLQILCDSIESMVAGGEIADRDRDGLPDVTASDLPDFDAVYGAYYERRLGHLPAANRRAARLLIEDGLVRYDPATDTKRRLSVDGDALLASFGKLGLTANLLQELEKTYLLRREPNTLGGYNYELSHDTLLEPVVAAKKKREIEEAERRRAEEEAAKQERLRVEAEAQRIEREKIQKARQRNILFTIGALLLLGWALWQTWQAGQQKKVADERSLAALAAERRAIEKDSVAQVATLLAEEQTRIAELKNKEALTEKERAELATLEANQQQRKAQDLSIRSVFNILKEADKEVKALEYAAAYRTLQSAEELGVLSDSIALAMMEIAFYTLESGHPGRAELITSRVARLLGKPNPGKIGSIAAGRTILKNLNVRRYKELVERYYPKMIHIKGGTFEMDSNYRVQVSDFEMAETETTFWQFALFCGSTGRPLKPHRPDWGISGDHPAVKVSWYEACLYANWVSKQIGRDTMYILTNREESDEPYLSESYSVGIRDAAKGFRLPTEAEWQFAAGGGAIDRTEWAGTSEEDSLRFYANIYGSEDGYSYTSPAKNYWPNQLALYDMSGNAWEYCWDWYGEYKTDSSIVVNPRGPDKGWDRVLRGGSWIRSAQLCRTTTRSSSTPADRYNLHGFRLVLSALPVSW